MYRNSSKIEYKKNSVKKKSSFSLSFILTNKANKNENENLLK